MILIEIRTQFEAFHRYLDAPDEVAFLRNYHRHTFKVELRFLTTHENRDLEFFIMKEMVDGYLRIRYQGQYFERSCEMIAKELGQSFNAVQVVVREDDENAGIFIKE